MAVAAYQQYNRQEKDGEQAQPETTDRWGRWTQGFVNDAASIL